MARGRSLLKGLGILFLFVLIFFVGIFFYAYFTGGEAGVLTALGGDSVGVVQIEGTINDSRDTIENLKRFGESSGIKALVLRIDSPGGAVAPTQEIYEEVEKLRKKKPVIASLGSVAASGGYYIASACDEVVSNPGTLTGSIGVIMELGNVEELMKKIGVQGYSIKSGANKDVGSPLRPLSPEGKQILQTLVNNVHGQFVAAVAKGRRMTEEQVKPLADGRVYSGEQAKALGLVDHLGNMEDAVERAATRVGIKGKPQVVYSRSDEKSWWERLFSSTFLRGLGRRESAGLRYEWSPSLLP
ncbi:MAG TPA: signal peptide peptidase SppA [Candidatus Binatia bacterium]|jgi:protease-4